MNMTHGDILEAERNGLPGYEPEIQECPTCGRMVDVESLSRCEKCKTEICPFCPNIIWVPEYGWRFCHSDCSVRFMVEQIQELEDENRELKRNG